MTTTVRPSAPARSTSGRELADQRSVASAAALTAAGFGFLLQFNVILQPFGLYFFHITDPLALAAALLLPLALLRGPELLAVSIAYLGLFAWLLLVLLAAGMRGDDDLYVRTFLYCYALCGTVMVLHATQRPILLPFCMGATIGAIASIGVLIADASADLALSRYGLAWPFDHASVTQAIAAGSRPADALRLAKAGGLWSAGNEAGPALALAAPAAAYWSWRRQSLLPYLLYLLAYLAGFAWVQNRSGLATVGLIGVVLYLRMHSWKRMFAFGLAGAVLLSGVLGALHWQGSAGSAVFEQRLLADRMVTRNLSQRAETGMAGVRIALEHPFGLSHDSRLDRMHAKTGMTTPHNGFISIAFQLGWVFALAALGATTFCLAATIKGDIFIFGTALALLGGLMAEELHANPVFQFHIGVAIGYPIALFAAYLRQSYARPIYHSPRQASTGLRAAAASSSRRRGARSGA